MPAAVLVLPCAGSWNGFFSVSTSSVPGCASNDCLTEQTWVGSANGSILFGSLIVSVRSDRLW
jgi:hypothetical protein